MIPIHIDFETFWSCFVSLWWFLFQYKWLHKNIFCFIVVCVLFKVVQYDTIRDHLCQTLLTLVRSERTGEAAVDRYSIHYILPVYGSLIQKCLKLLLINSGLMHFRKGF